MDLAILSNWFCQSDSGANLVGTQCAECKTFYFPPQMLGCKNPDCEAIDCEAILLNKVLLSRIGRLWSYTNACQRPPEPYECQGEFKPFAIAAVELDQEKMIVLGQLSAGFEVTQLKIGMLMELVIEPLHEGGHTSQAIWKWRPVFEQP